ncbi:MAG TPA: hypothetical protein VD970_03020 [Acetobacteraceae bacterium]|nr:hypothetical protein [Acetobacteraceae bacterium]
MALSPDRDDTRTNGKVPATEARQGVTHHNVRYVLMISLILVVIGFVVAYFVA